MCLFYEGILYCFVLLCFARRKTDKRAYLFPIALMCLDSSALLCSAGGGKAQNHFD